MFSETEMARAYKEIAVRDPRFDMVLFLQRLKKDVPVVVKGSLEGNKPVLKEHCAPEMVERFSGIHNAKTQQVGWQLAEGLKPLPAAVLMLLGSEQLGHWGHVCTML